ncbi:ATP-dependent nuclease [Tenacibaculum piscium]|uniref:ATP-dependent nuclease n=1 Tax=Tenacibaculum piscium TaxID=1458515 RepID=UPI001F35C5CF|nr:AAA family ATPase [Tenacibaculum piscium]
MKLEKITIENYKSIDEIEFIISEINNSFTYSLLGINESGKSSFLKGISLFDNEDIYYPQDFFLDSKPVKITLNYIPSKKNILELKKELSTTHKFGKEILDKLEIKSVQIIAEFEPSETTTKTFKENIVFETEIFSDYIRKENIPNKKTKEEIEIEDFNLSTFFAELLPKYFWNLSHQVVFWKSSPEYLILDDIDLLKFASEPKKTSIPLLNCFSLAGIKEDSLDKEIAKLISPVAISSLQSKLSELTTEHINKVWPEHPITITFLINNNKISLLIEDNGVKFQPKTTGQRSDGFKQFISFLLTISVENYNEELSKTILLIDEPETHLHPPAQINLLGELIKITSNNNNNILFFATHSNYLIDKRNLDRNHKVSKKENHKTSINKIEKKTSTYSEVNYEVFGIETSDYHNELYGYIESEDKTLLNNLNKSKKWINSKTKKEYQVSLSEYIRHSIHHPENELNKKYTDKELNQSIKILRETKASI